MADPIRHPQDCDDCDLIAVASHALKNQEASGRADRCPHCGRPYRRTDVFPQAADEDEPWRPSILPTEEPNDG